MISMNLYDCFTMYWIFVILIVLYGCDAGASMQGVPLLFRVRDCLVPFYVYINELSGGIARVFAKRKEFCQTQRRGSMREKDLLTRQFLSN